MPVLEIKSYKSMNMLNLTSNGFTSHSIRFKMTEIGILMKTSDNKDVVHINLIAYNKLKLQLINFVASICENRRYEAKNIIYLHRFFLYLSPCKYILTFRSLYDLTLKIEFNHSKFIPNQT